MLIEIDGVACEYETHIVNDGDTLVFLHGWGGDLRSFAGAYNAACDWGVNAVNVALPKTVPSDWGIYDYATLTERVLQSAGVENPILIGHSFGGRVAVILASQGKCKKLVLTGSAGLKPRFDIRKKYKIAKYRYRVKHGKPLDGTGSIDYNNTEVGMRGVFVRIVNSHLDRLLPYIKCKTLIVWGKTDRETPPYMARRFKRGIADSALVFIDGGHYGYVESNCKFLRLVKSFVLE